MSRFEEDPIPTPEPEPIPEPTPEPEPEPEPEVDHDDDPEPEPEPEPGESPEEHRKRKGGYQRKLERERKAAEDARAEAAYLRGQLEALKPQTQPVASADGEPTQDQFDDYDSYLRALTRWEVKQELKQETERSKAQSVENAWKEKETLAKSRFADYDEVADLRQLSPTPAMAQTILELELGTEVLYWLGKHPQENARIKTLSPMAQAVALGKIESQLAIKPETKPKPQAPAPLGPVTPLGKGAPAVKSARYEEY